MADGDEPTPLTLEDLKLADDLNQDDAAAAAAAKAEADSAAAAAAAAAAAPKDWRDGITEADLVDLAKPFPTPLDALKALATEKKGKGNGAWRDGITDEKLKNVAAQYNSPADLVAAVQAYRTDQSTRIKVPAADAPAEEVAKFREAIGVPEKAEEYEVTPPEGVELLDSDKGIITALQPIALESGVPKTAFNAFMAATLKLSNDLRQQTVDAINKAQDDSVAALKKRWGNDYDANMNLGHRAIEQIGGEDLKKLMDETLVGKTRLSDHPVMAEFFAKLGRSTAEGEIFVGLGTTPEERQTTIQQIEAIEKEHPIGSAGYTSPDVQKRLQALYAKLGNAPVVGAQGRAF